MGGRFGGGGGGGADVSLGAVAASDENHAKSKVDDFMVVGDDPMVVTIPVVVPRFLQSEHREPFHRRRVTDRVALTSIC